jgi:SAM-dependent methyltransferase
MDIVSRVQIIKYHSDSIKRFGLGSHQALGWKEKENQLIRFNALVNGLPLEDSSVLDVGCGTGDLLQFFHDKNIKCDYTGIDQVKEFIEYAASKYEDKNSSFLLGDFCAADLNKYDFILASGAFSYRNPDPNFVYKMIARLFALSKKAFAFNLLENVELKEGNLVAYDKKEIMDFCEKLSSEVILKDNYVKGDYTVIMKY